MRSKVFLKRAIGVLAVSLLGLVAVVPVGAAVVPAKKLSLSNVTLYSASSDDTTISWTAEHGGFFSKQGLDVNLITQSAGSAAAAMAGFLSGSFTFINVGLVTGLAADSSGQIKQIMNTNIGQQQEIAISNNVAAQFHVSSADTTPAQSLAQLEALKGSHISVAVTNTSSPSYFDLVAVCKTHGLTCGLNSPNDDINIQSAGSATTQIAGLTSGKFQGIANEPPNSVQPNTVVINMGNITPVEKAPGYGILTTAAMISEHSDTVQAFVNGEMNAFAFVKQHPTAAKNYLTQDEGSGGINDPSEIAYIYTDTARYWITPLILRSGFDELKQVYDLVVSPPTPQNYTSWDAPQFTAKAAKSIKYKFTTQLP